MAKRNLDSILCDLISINSINPDYTGSLSDEASLMEYIGKLLENHGIPYRMEEVLPGRMNLIAKLEGRSNTGLCLEAHADTVGIEGMTIEPFTPEYRDGMIYGRGSCDAKGSMAAMLHAMLSMKDRGCTPATDIYFVAAVDEEYLCRGAKHLISTGFRVCSAVIGEPSSLQIVTACKGVARYRLKTAGVAAHSAKPAEGVNAIYKMAEIICRINQELCPAYAGVEHPLLGSPTINVGVVKGGSLINIVPDECCIDVDRRMLPGETYESIIDEMKDLATRHEIDLCEPELLLYDEAMETAPDCPLVRSAREIKRELELEDGIYGVGYCCDGTKFSRAGISSIVLGPGDIKYAHSACEFVPLGECELASELYQRLCMREDIG